MNERPTELKRQTGRTTRMVQHAIDTVTNGWSDNVHAVVVMHNANMVPYAKRLMAEYLSNKDLSADKINQTLQRITTIHLQHSHMKFISVKMIGTGPYSFWPVFVDHDAAFKLIPTTLIEAWLKYDLSETGSTAYRMLVGSSKSDGNCNAAVMALEFLEFNGEHVANCEVFDLDEHGAHKNCTCGLEATLKALRSAVQTDSATPT